MGIWNGQGDKTWEKVVTSLHMRSLAKGHVIPSTNELNR